MLDLNALYEVIVYTLGETKAGTKMGKLQLKNVDDGTLLNCIMWEETVLKLDEKLFRPGNVLKIVNATFNEKYNNCLVSDLKLVKEARAGLNTEEKEELFAFLKATVNDFKDEKLKDFVSGLLDKYGEQFKIAPAAKLMHHNYAGGLLQHTTECVKIAENVLKMFPEKLEREETIAACILHDFGKIFEYNINEETGLIDYENSFNSAWISHSQWGFTACMTAGFQRIAKMIAAHHGRIDWGAMIDLNQKELEPFVYVLHHIDDLSAKFGKTTVAELE